MGFDVCRSLEEDGEQKLLPTEGWFAWPKSD